MVRCSAPSVKIPEKESESIREITLYANSAKGQSLVVDVVINGTKVPAVLDTAAQVTVLSEKMATNFSVNPESTEFVKLKGANIGGQFRARLARNVCITMGQVTYFWDVYIAPISDGMLIGLDFLTACGAVINLENKSVIIAGESIEATLVPNQSSQQCQINRVIVRENIQIPPRSVTHTPLVIEGSLKCDIVVQPTVHPNLLAEGLVMPSSLVSNMSQVYIYLGNTGNKPISLTEGSVLGVALEVDEKWAIEDLCCEDDFLADDSRLQARKVRQPDTFQVLSDSIPGHLRDLLDRSVEGLSQEQALTVAELLVEFSDIFAKNDLELGCFGAIKHKIDTQSAPPIRQRMRRTPLGFEKEEKKHLDDMLDAGVVQPSTSEWASPPVLVRKKDGGVRWCVDFRQLNNVTRKDSYPLPLIESCLDALSGVEFISTLDLQSG